MTPAGSLLLLVLVALLSVLVVLEVFERLSYWWDTRRSRVAGKWTSCPCCGRGWKEGERIWLAPVRK